MISVESIREFHRHSTQQWHKTSPHCEQEGIMGLICKQHRFNFMLWHEEDLARSPTATDAQIAAVKRSIDSLNQSRNDATEEIDCLILDYLASSDISVDRSAPLNSETPGSIIDRLSILALRIYHLHEQLQRDDLTGELSQTITGKLEIAGLQQDDLANCLQQLWDDLCSGRKRHQLYRQLKMYNDPNLNPYLYVERRKKT